MTIGIGGAGGKIAAKLNKSATVFNVSAVELQKVNTEGSRFVAAVHSERGQCSGSRKEPNIGREAYASIKENLKTCSKGDIVLSSTGGGTGNGICSSLLEDLANENKIEIMDKTAFAFILPYPRLEATDFVNNTIKFLAEPLSKAIDSGNTGNIILFSNKVKFEHRIAEEDFNNRVVDSLSTFLSIPSKNSKFKLLDGHIDAEDFLEYRAKPYFNHFTYFTYDQYRDFGDQLRENYNNLLLPPENPIEALFLLEVPSNYDSTIFYNILNYFGDMKVPPVYSVVENPDLGQPFVTVSLLYSRKPKELVDDFSNIAQDYIREKANKTINQHIKLNPKKIDICEEIQASVINDGSGQNEVLAVLKRLGKL